MEYTKKKKHGTSYTYKTAFEFSRHIQRSMWKKRNIDIPTEEEPCMYKAVEIGITQRNASILYMLGFHFSCFLIFRVPSRI